MKKQQMRGFLRSAEKMVQELQDMQNKEARAEFHRRMEGDEEVPLPIRGVLRGEVERVALRGVGRAFQVVHDGARRQRLRQQQNNRKPAQHSLNHKPARDEPRQG